jgi:hypothetical protein
MRRERAVGLRVAGLRLEVAPPVSPTPTKTASPLPSLASHAPAAAPAASDGNSSGSLLAALGTGGLVLLGLILFLVLRRKRPEGQQPGAPSVQPGPPPA